MKEEYKLSGLGSKRETISMEPVKEKLRNLKEYMPNEKDVIYQFGEYLADRLNPELVPGGFNIATELALYDLQEGVDGFTGQPIRNDLADCPPVVYALLKIKVPDIAEAVCPEDFAKDEKEIYEQVNAEMQKKQK